MTPSHTPRRWLAALLIIYALLDPSSARAQTIETNRAQRSTVRVFAVRGVDVVEVPSQTKQQKRPFGVPRAGHGSGLLLASDGLVLTAKHVVEGARLLAIRAPGHERAHSAKVVYLHPKLDLAFLVCDGLFADHIPLPERSPTMAMGTAAVAIGYPLDSAEELPTQMSGSVAGLTRDRHYKLSMGLNPGNSGGPVFTAEDQLFGIAIKTVDPRRGAQGLSIAVPLEPIVEAFAKVKNSYQEHRDTLEDNSIADLAAELVIAGADGLHAEVKKLAGGPTRTRIYNAIEAAADKTKHPDVQALLAAYFFDLAGAILEHNRAYDVSEMAPGKDRDDAAKAVKLSISLAQKAVDADPTLKQRSPFVGVLLRAASAPSPAPPAPPPYTYRTGEDYSRPKYLDYVEGDPIPEGYKVDTKLRTGLVVGGAVTLGVLWGITAIAGGVGASVEGEIDGDTDQFIPLYIPVAGPFVAIDTMDAAGAGVAVLIIDGVAQTAGLAMFIAGLAAPKDVLRRTTVAGISWQLTPSHRGFGVGLDGTF